MADLNTATKIERRCAKTWHGTNAAVGHIIIQPNYSFRASIPQNLAKNHTKNLTIKILIVKIFYISLILNIEKYFTKPLTNAFWRCIFAA